MLEIERTNQFKRDYKLAVKRGSNIAMLVEVITALVNEQDLPAKHRPHKLSGDYSGLWECHITPDFLMIYEITPEYLVLYRLGSHSDLF